MPPFGYNNQYRNPGADWGANQRQTQQYPNSNPYQGGMAGRQATPGQYMSRPQMQQGQMQRPMQQMPQGQMQRPMQQMPQGQMQRPMQQMPQGQMQRPMQQTPQGQMQRPMQQMPQGQMQRPMQQMPQGQMQGPMQQTPQQMPQQFMPQQQMPAQGQMQQQMPQQQMPSPGQPPMQGMPMALPDGIRMEPLDEKALRELQNRAAPTTLPNTEKPPPDQAESPPASPQSNNNVFQLDVMEALGQFIQNERNGEIFYRNLADMAIHNEHRSFIEEITSDSKKRRISLGELYAKHKGSNYSIKESAIDTTVNFKNGIALAIKEESQALRQLSQLYEKTKDPEAAHVINSILYRKTGDLSILHYIYMNGK